MEIQRIHVSELQVMAEAISKSGLFGLKTQEQALAMMLLAQAEGLHPATAARDYHIIQGRPTLKTDAMMARFQAAGGKVEWKTYSDDEVTGVFSHPAGGTVQITWTLDQAKKAGLAGKDVWKQFPRAMLRARVISEGIRTVFPGVVVGVYTPEEVQDFDTAPPVALVPDFEPAPQPRTGARSLTEQVSNPQPAASRGNLITRQQTLELAGIVKAAGFDQTDEGKQQARNWFGWLLGSPVESVLTLTKTQAEGLLEKLASPQKIEASINTWYEHLNAQGLPDATGA